MSVTIRPANAADAAAIARVHVDTWRTAYRGIVPQSYLDALDVAARTEGWNAEIGKGDSFIFVAEEAGAVCGFIGGGMARESMQEYDAELYAVYVLAGEQRRSVGTRLLSALADVLIQHGFSRLMVWVLADNPCRNFYAQLGGVPFAEKPIEIGESKLIEVAYGWEGMGKLGR